MALEWLKGILGEAYSEDIDKKVGAQLGTDYALRTELDAANESKTAAEAQLAEASKTLDGLKTQDETVQKQIADYRQRAEQAEKDRDEKVSNMQFNARLDGAIGASKGKNAKAIKALLDMDALHTSKNQEADIKAALDAIKTESDYLFDTSVPQPQYAAGTGTTALPGTKYTAEELEMRAAADLKSE